MARDPQDSRTQGQGARTLRDWRTQVYHMEQKEFAEEVLHVSVSTYRAWEQGVNRPRFPKQREIARALGVEVTQIILPESPAKKDAA